MNAPIAPSPLDLRPLDPDPFWIARSLWDVQQAWLAHPSELAEAIIKLGTGLALIQSNAIQQVLGVKQGSSSQVNKEGERDDRFKDPQWTENPFFALLKQYYLLSSRWLVDTISATPDLDPKTQRRATFWARQVLDALAPSNFFWTNPQALQRFVETGGGSLVEGFRLYLQDTLAGEVRMVDSSAFHVGKNLATTPGEVVFRNNLLELIQYTPTTTQVRAIPIVIVAPWINKYYILDLTPQKSLVRWLVAQGYTVFITSWKNPGREMRDVQFEDYLQSGLLPALEVARQLCQSPSVHAVGYCIGGTLLACLQAWLAQEETTPPLVSSWTLYTTLVDFSQPGDVEMFITEDSIALLERIMAEQGYLDGAQMAQSFRLLRPNSLLWNYVIQSYLYGNEPPPLDVLYWNTDTTRLPMAMHSFYLRQFYLHNRLIEPGSTRLAGRSLDLSRITAPLYAVGTDQDHIAPWKGTFSICRWVQGPVRYALTSSGHILGVINPPVNPPKRHYWAAEASGATDPEAWQAGASQHKGSWWEDWRDWLAGQTGELVPSRRPGSNNFPPLEAAPGSYVLER